MLNNDTTNLNHGLLGNETKLNRQIDDNYLERTAINTAFSQASGINKGIIFCGKYTVQEKLSVPSGEADLFLCTYGKGKYVAKVYRRKVAIKKDVIEALAGVYSPYIAHIFDLGEFNGFPVEILPYYENGSLQGKRFSYEQLKQNIIPALNEGLKVLHDNGIIHKDLKPSNIMLNADEKTVSIIDFGISSIRENGNTIIVTKTGMTPEYSAPETFKGLFLNESDYYSLGVTIYELYTGHTPYENLYGDELERVLTVQKIPLQKDLPAKLQELITALTYADITNRKEMDNPNRRWTYEEVKKWYNDIEQPIPGTTDFSTMINENFRPYKFLGNVYYSEQKLVDAFNEHWTDGKKQLYRGLLTAFYKQFDPEMAGICMDAEEEVENGDEDIVFFKILYNMDLNREELIWKGWKFADLYEFGNKLFRSLQENDKSMEKLLDELLVKGVLSLYCEIQKYTNKNQIQLLKTYEAKRRNINTDNRIKTIDNYELSYVLTGNKGFQIKEESFSDIDQLTLYMVKLLHKSPPHFDDFCDKLIDNDKNLSPHFESWLISIGKKSEIEKWKQVINRL